MKVERDMRIVNCPFCVGRDSWFYSIREYREHMLAFHDKKDIREEELFDRS